MQELLLNPTFLFIACGITTNVIIVLACYHLGRNNPSNAALERFFLFLLDHPFLFELALSARHKVQPADQNKTEQPSTTPNP